MPNNSNELLQQDFLKIFLRLSFITLHFYISYIKAYNGAMERPCYISSRVSTIPRLTLSIWFYQTSWTELPQWNIWRADVSSVSLSLWRNSTFINSFDSDKTQFSCFTLPSTKHNSFFRINHKVASTITLLSKHD